MKFTYEEGMRVRTRDEDEHGIIVELIDDGDDEVRIIWDGSEDRGAQWCETRYIMPDTPEAPQQIAELNQQIQSKIDDATNLLEQAFKSWRQAHALQMGVSEEEEARYYEGAYGFNENPALDLSKFESVVEQNGWSTSSLYC